MRWKSFCELFFTPLVAWDIKSSTPTTGITARPATPFVIPYK